MRGGRSGCWGGWRGEASFCHELYEFWRGFMGTSQTRDSRISSWLAGFLTIGMILVATFAYNQVERHTWVAEPILVYYQEEPGWFTPEYNWAVPTPHLVIYNTGQVFQFIRDGDNQREVKEKYLSHRELCNFLLELDNNGFMDVGPNGYTYPPNVHVLDGGYTLVKVQSWKQQEMFAHVLGFVIDEGYASSGVVETYKLLRNFELANSNPYIPQQIEMRIELYEQQTAGIVWPFPEQPLVDLYRDGYLETPTRTHLILDGDWAEKIYHFFENRIRLIFFEENAFFRVSIRPLLPYENRDADRTYPIEFSVSSDAPKVRMSCP